MFANLLALSETSVYHQFSRLQSMTEWWHWLLLLIASAVVVAYIAVTYYFDSVELSVPLRWSLFALRVLAFAGILFYFLDLEKRAERQIPKNSRALMLIDTSLSMGIQDGTDGSGPSRRRIDTVVDEMQRGDLVNGLRESHDVVVYRFDQGVAPTEIASLPKDGGVVGSFGVSGERRKRSRRLARSEVHGSCRSCDLRRWAAFVCNFDVFWHAAR